MESVLQIPVHGVGGEKVGFTAKHSQNGIRYI